MKTIWVIGRVEVFPNGDMRSTTASAATDMQKAYNLLDREIWFFIKERGYAVQDEMHGLAQSTVVLENATELMRVILTCTKTALQ